MTTTTTTTPNLTTSLARLQYFYQDVTRLSAIASPSLVLHPADRDLSSPPRPPLVGIAAAQRHEQEFVAAAAAAAGAGVTMVMDVESITVGRDGTFAAVEHWENAADPEALVRWLKGV
ncbi:hypothetical protein NEMBOFW57_001799 [Staphylotrichum longicolle]|uniref:Uncharacterized protein n=1 Tax=Staphylotrichum longicolle TaxID=669026 RepID=A0AAD4F281_9PEZI|nr:hypothetical protein NEMBOFW57_001799 [Staphylotrichum longicolle]